MKIITLLLMIILATSLQAHPVIYKGGWVYAGHFAPKFNSQRVGYSLTPKVAVEANSNYYQNYQRYRDYTFGINYLFKRWLNQDSQGNLYGSIHPGYFEKSDDSGLTTHLMLQGDWESRKLYTAAHLMSMIREGKTDIIGSYRFGIAPYVAGMDTLQTWIIGKIDYFKENDRRLMFTPMMRFFYKNVLWEIGSSTSGAYFLTLMTHY